MRQRQIAKAALRILSTHGARRMTAAALASEVGIADGTIFRHFANMEEIVHAAIDVFEATLEDSYPPVDGEPLERLGAFFVQRLTLVRKNPELLRLAFNDRLAEAAGEGGAARVERTVERSVAFVHDALRDAQSDGLVTRDVPTMLLVWMVIGVVRGAATAPGKTMSRASPRRLWTVLERFLRSTARRSS